MNERWWFAVGIAALLALGAHARLRPAAPAPALRAPGSAEPWMVDALPGIGGRRLEAALPAVRRGDFGALPEPARGCAAQVFEPPAGAASLRQR